MRTIAIIPAHNEEKRISKVIRKTKKYVKNVVVVDDGSKDQTVNCAEQENVVVLKHIINLGKGAALKTGCEYAVMNGFDHIVVLDSDGQHDPAEIPLFLDALKKTDVVFGSRSFNKNMPFVMRFGNWFIRQVNKQFFGVSIQDTQSGYRAFTSHAYKKMRWKSLNYSVESEMIANVGKKNLKYKEIKITTKYLDRYKGTTILDGIKIVLNMFWWKLSR